MIALKSSILKGFFWTGIDVGINRGFYVLLQLVLAKLLFPEAYGIVAMAAVFIALLEIGNDLGLRAALIQQKSKNLTNLHYDTAFWTSIGWGLLLYTFIYFVATPLISTFYGETILNTVVPYMALTIVLSPIANIHRAKLIKALAFKNLTLVNTLGTLGAGAVSLYLAYQGFGVWALISYSVLKTAIAVPLLVFSTRWIPSLRWNMKAFRLLFGFGVFTLGTSIANVISQKIDFLLIGKFMGAIALGYYSFAFLLTHVLRQQISSVLSKVMYPVYARLQEEPQKLFSIYLKILSVNAIIVYPIMLGVFLFSGEVLLYWFGHKWNEVIPLLKILSVSVLLQITVYGNQILFRAYGKVKLEFRLQLVKSFVFFVPFIYIGVMLYGILGAAIGYALATLCSAMVTLYFLKKIFILTTNDLFNAFQLPMSMLVVCASFTWGILHYVNWQLGLLLYGIAVLLFYRLFAKKEVYFIMSILKNRYPTSATY